MTNSPGNLANLTIQNDADVYYRKHLGGNWYVSITQWFPCVNIRKYWTPEGATEITPTRKGVILSFSEFGKFSEAISELDEALPELEVLVPCYLEHQTQLAGLRCSECNPDHSHEWRPKSDLLCH